VGFCSNLAGLLSARKHRHHQPAVLMRTFSPVFSHRLRLLRDGLHIALPDQEDRGTEQGSHLTHYYVIFRSILASGFVTAWGMFYIRPVLCCGNLSFLALSIASNNPLYDLLSSSRHQVAMSRRKSCASTVAETSPARSSCWQISTKVSPVMQL
jgi:hypothetical protein